MVAMKGFALALEPHFIEEIDEAMKHLDFARSERYRSLIILGLDEYAISDSKLRKKRFPIKGEIGESFSVMLSDAINKEVMSVKEKRKQTKKLAMRYIVLLGFEKFKRDQDNLKCQKVEPVKNEVVEDPKKEHVQKPFVPLQRKNELSEESKSFIEKHNYRFDKADTVASLDFHKNNIAALDPDIKPVSNDMNIGEKFQAVIDLVRELDLKITIEKK